MTSEEDGGDWAKALTHLCEQFPAMGGEQLLRALTLLTHSCKSGADEGTCPYALCERLSSSRDMQLHLTFLLLGSYDQARI